MNFLQTSDRIRRFLALTGVVAVMAAGVPPGRSALPSAELSSQSAPVASSAPKSEEGGPDFFENKVRPLLVERCYECHSVAAKKIKGGLTVDSREGLLKGGDSGPVIVPGSPEKSLIIKAVRYADKDLQMPPAHQLTAQEISLLEKWVAMGAPDPRTNSVARLSTNSGGHWAFQPISNPDPPAVANRRWPQNSIDRFILAKLESNGLTPNFNADKHTLIRRVTFDLTGLPPTPAEVSDFLQDRSPAAFEKVIDRLFASPRYGERWGRYWLDLARYSVTAGDSADYPIPQAYKYRDYVIDVFNCDKPYDQFIREQIAGDLLPAASERDKHQKLIATGYLALARRFGVDPPSAHHLTLEDAIDTMGRSILGLSLSCARCHDHKYDPIPTADYYGLYGIFSSTRFPFPGSENKRRPADLITLIPLAEAEAVMKPFTNQLTLLDARIAELENQVETLRRERLNSADVRKSLAEAQTNREDLIAHAPSVEAAFAVAEGKPGNARIQRRGEPGKLEAEVPRHFLQVLGGQLLPKSETGSGRLELADWLTSPRNPLTARVIVNRVWQHHFGKGLVQTSSDFGTRGSRPTHPELLDYLARQFMQNGWSLKTLHKEILLSRTYQQSSIDNFDYASLDPGNELLWKFNRQRLDAEAIRDTLLVVAGDLDWNPGGPHPFPSPYAWEFSQHNQFTAVYETRKRSIYLMQQRIKKHPFLATFDAADPNASTGERSASTTPLQALFMMNDPFAHEAAAHFAARLEPRRPKERIQTAYQIAFGRPARPEEVDEAMTYLRTFCAADRTKALSTAVKGELAWASFTRALLSSNEFLYID